MSGTLSLGASIVLYRTPSTAVRPLVLDLLEQGAERIYLINNGADRFDAFRDWLPPDRVTTLASRANLGYGRANNMAIRQSVGLHKYHLICNPDISLRPGALVKLHAMLESRPDVGLCMPRVVGLDGCVQHLCKRSPLPLDYLSGLVAPRGWGRNRRMRLEMRDRPYDEEMEVECLSGCFMLFRSCVLQALQGFDERFFLYFEDFDLSRRAHRFGRNLYYPAAEVVHAHAREHRHSLRIRMNFIASAIRYFNKWGWFG